MTLGDDVKVSRCSDALVEILQRAETLTPEDQLYLAAHLVEKARQAYLASRPRRRWREICGVAPYPLVGEDAQAWVSRTRRESDDHRERLWRPET